MTVQEFNDRYCSDNSLSSFKRNTYDLMMGISNTLNSLEILDREQRIRACRIRIENAVEVYDPSLPDKEFLMAALNDIGQL